MVWVHIIAVHGVYDMAWTYATLTSAIQNWTENDATEFTSIIDDIIALAELRILKEVDLTISRKETTTSITSGANVAAVPSDIIVPRWIRIQNGAYLLPKDESFMREYSPTSSTSGAPRYYAWSGDGATNFIISPYANATTTLEVGYTYRITGLSSGNTTNWLGTNAPDVLLYACLLEAALFEKQEQQELQKITMMYERALQTLAKEEQEKRRTDNYRAGEQRL